MARLWADRPPRDAGPRGIRAPLEHLAPGMVVTLGLLLAGLVPASDVSLYRWYGAGFFHHRLPREYPALAGLIFSLPRLLPFSYRLGFALLMAAALVVIFVIGGRIVPVAGGPPGPDSTWTGRFVCYVSLGTVAVVLSRFDLLPALALLLAVERARAERWPAAWAWGVAGGLLKVFPFLLLPGFALLEWRASGRLPWRRAAATAAALGAFAIGQSLLAPGSLLRPISYELRRGFEFSSLPGSLSLLLAPGRLVYSVAFGTHEVSGAGHEVVAAATMLAGLGALGAVWALAWKGRMPVEAVSLAVISAAVIADKALAPQYLLWLAPLWSYWRLRPAWLVASALTAVVFPILFLAAGVEGSLFPDTVLAAVRNAALVGGTVAWLAEGLRSRWAQRITTPDMPDDPTEVVACPLRA